MALAHYPVVNRQGVTIASAVTNLDIHDIARAGRTYGISGYYVVTPLSDQKRLVESIVSHWTDGVGAKHNPWRAEAFRLVRVCETIEDAADRIRVREKVSPLVVATSARRHDSPVNIGFIRSKLEDVPVLLVFGTAWGLAPEFLKSADHILEPLAVRGGYNHLSVRSAVSIILDRLLGDGV
ncbi:MAG: hypothetical protein B5M56_02195 [Desulfococcus sp. 4484_241]|nr:MAG: hypothetical protein B5M56_02195 [Desulfococcus sp. 4484_241]